MSYATVSRNTNAMHVVIPALPTHSVLRMWTLVHLELLRSIRPRLEGVQTDQQFACAQLVGCLHNDRSSHMMPPREDASEDDEEERLSAQASLAGRSRSTSCCGSTCLVSALALGELILFMTVPEAASN